MKKRLVCFALLVILMSACTSPANSELARNRAKWQAANLGHYWFNLFVGCFCPFTQKMPLYIEVKDHQVVSMTYKDGTAVPEADRPMYIQYETIEALFSFTQDAMSRADEIHVAYNPNYGFPSSVQIDFVKNAIDDEMSLSVPSFEPLP